MNGVRNVAHVLGAIVPNQASNGYPNVILDFSRPKVVKRVTRALSITSVGDEQGADVISGASTGSLGTLSTATPKNMCAITKFCTAHLVSRVEPTQAEMEALLVECTSLEADKVVSAIYEQLTWTAGSNDWQPRLRALCLLEYFYGQGGAGKSLAFSVVEEATMLLHSLMDVPQCCERAERVLDFMPHESMRPEPVGVPAVEHVDAESEFAELEFEESEVEWNSRRFTEVSSCSTTDQSDENSDVDEQTGPHGCVRKPPGCFTKQPWRLWEGPMQPRAAASKPCSKPWLSRRSRDTRTIVMNRASL